MIRPIARSLEEIHERHACVRRVNNVDPLLLPLDTAPYAAITIVASCDAIAATLTTALPALRADYEVHEIYARVRGDGSLFEPLASRHFAHEGEWVAIARRRHPSNEPRIVGIMLAKDEADAIPEVVPNLTKALDALYYFSGDTATHEAIQASAPAGWAHHVSLVAVYASHTDGLRQILLEAARADAIDDPRPMWVMVVQGDEIYHDDLRQHILRAQTERATAMTCQVATFLLHESQKDGWDWTLPLAARLTHYIWDFGEHAGFLDFPWIYYVPTEHMRAHPHGIFPAKWTSTRPVRKHYPFRTPEQAKARIEDRLRVSLTHPHGWQPHYKNYRDVFVGSNVAGREVKNYHGWFGEAERVEGIW